MSSSMDIKNSPFFPPRMQKKIDAQTRATTSACLIRTLHHASPHNVFKLPILACSHVWVGQGAAKSLRLKQLPRVSS